MIAYGRALSINLLKESECEYNAPIRMLNTTCLTNGLYYSLDQDRAQARDRGDFDPDYQERDYEQVAEMLPVFCVSSKVYHKISGNMGEDEVVSGFPTLQNTEVTALQEHAFNIVRSIRGSVLRGFYNDVHQYLAALMLQVVVSDEPLKLAAELRAEELKFLGKAAADLNEVRVPFMERRHGFCSR